MNKLIFPAIVFLLINGCASLPPDERTTAFSSELNVSTKKITTLLKNASQMASIAGMRIDANRDAIGLAPANAEYIVKLVQEEKGRLFLINKKYIPESENKEMYISTIINIASYLKSDSPLTAFYLKDGFLMAKNISEVWKYKYPIFIENGIKILEGDFQNYLFDTFSVIDQELRLK